MPPDADLLILGGGCAGLSLGMRLADHASPTGRTVILEARTEYANDRTWCFWRLAPHRFDQLVAHSWSAVAIRTKQRSVTVDCRLTPYQMLEATPFYAEAQDRIDRSKHVDLVLGASVRDTPRRVAGMWQVETETGLLTASHVVDTRPVRPPRASDAMLWQSFFGQEIDCAASVFDANTVGLMDFAEARTDDVLFHYVLPLSPCRALIETTVFGPRPLVPADLSSVQAAAVEKLVRGNAFSVRRAESGVLPMGMTTCFPVPGPDYSRAGLMSGAARASSGYAFQRIQRWADAAAASIGRGGPPIGHQSDPALQRRMDHLFLRIVRDHPDRAPDLFIRMFGNADPARVIRFLSDQGTLADCAVIGSTLPLQLFIGEMLKSMVAAPSALREAA